MNRTEFYRQLADAVGVGDIPTVLKMIADQFDPQSKEVVQTVIRENEDGYGYPAQEENISSLQNYMA